MDQLNLFPEGNEGDRQTDNSLFLSEINNTFQQEDEEIQQVAEASEPEPEEESKPANTGTERNLGQMIEDAGLYEDLTPAVTDFIDKTLGTDLSGFYEQRKKDTAEQREAIAKGAEEFRQNQPEAVKVVTGALQGVGEKALGLGEVIGDTSKTVGENVVKFASFQTIKPDWTRGGKDNPLAGNYDWATWNLGKDEYGAQTDIGKGIQGITEFGLTMALTGGFAGGGTTIAGNIVRGGARGVAADAISALSGEGNMSNMIEDSFPELKDTWLTALAIDKEDNVYTAATKTALEGFGLGALIEGSLRYGWRLGKGFYDKFTPARIAKESKELVPVAGQLYHGTHTADGIKAAGFRLSSGVSDPLGAGVYFSSDPNLARAYGPEILEGSSRNLRIKNLSRDELAALKAGDADADPVDPQFLKNAFPDYDGVSVKGFYDDKPDLDEVVVFDAAKATELINTQPITQQEKVADLILKSGNTKRFEGYSQILDMNAAGIPTTWDDAAAVVPEYFLSAAPGIRREVMADFAQATYDRLDEMVERKLPGGTFDPFTGETPVSGTMVAIDGEVLEDLGDPDAVAAFIMKNQGVLSRPDVFLGSWIDPRTGKAVVELSRLVEDGDEAEMLGRMFDQVSLFRLDDFEEIVTEGDDVLRHTKGQHLKSAYTTPHEPTITPAPKVMAQQVEAMTSPVKPANGGGGERLATNAQVKQIADARGDEAGELVEQLIRNTPVDPADTSKTTKISQSELKELVQYDLANMFDVDGRVLTQHLDMMKYGDEDILSERGTMQVRALMANTASAIYDAAYKISKTAQEGIPPDIHLDVMKDNLLTLLKMHKFTANLFGRRLSTYSINVADLEIKIGNPTDVMTPQKIDQAIESAERELNNMVKGLESGDRKSMQQALRTASLLQLTAGDATKMIDVAANMGSLTGDGFLKLMYNSMLSAPATHVVNNLSNAFNLVYRPLTAAVGGSAKQRKAAIASYYTVFKTVPEAMDLAFRTLKTGVSNMSGDRGLIQAGQTRAALNELALRAEESNNMALKAGSALIHTLHAFAEFPLFSWPERLLTTSDEFFKVMVTRMEFSRLQMEKAIDLAGSEGDSAIKETYERLLKSEYSRNFTKSGGVVNDELLKGAKEVTFQTDLEGTAAAFGQIVNDMPALRIFFPFVKTGHNVLVYTGTHIPVLNMALKESREVIFKDSFEGAVMRGRLAFGSMTMLAAGMLATQGIITGNGPVNRARRKEWMKTHQPRSLRVGDRWVSYDRVEPFGQILAAVADIQYAFESAEMEEEQAKYLVGYLSHALAVNLTDKSMMQGLEPLSALLNARNISLDSLSAFGFETANNFFPLSGARRALTNSMHPYMQEFNNQYERAVYSASLGTAGERAVSHDWLTGEKITAGNGGPGNANLPFKVVKRGADPVKDKLEDIQFDTSVISEELGGVELTPEQKSKYQLYISQTGIYDKLKAWMLTDSFDRAHQEYMDRVGRGERIKKENQYFYRRITQLLRDAKKIAVLRLRNDFPDLNAEIMLDKYAAQSDRLPNGYQSLINFGNE